ncbi:unnamed protein product [Candida verbasci]|uniref:Uncharacterized protein n=1 Tax=Candida verbasci TaxID=1227364 RepID=A0A9W4TQW4_9ASCO|nr:unnamed protein product [Candida verbasci]
MQLRLIVLSSLSFASVLGAKYSNSNSNSNHTYESNNNLAATKNQHHLNNVTTNATNVTTTTTTQAGNGELGSSVNFIGAIVALGAGALFL